MDLPSKPDFYKKIPSFIFSFKSTQIHRIIDFIKDKYKSKEIEYYQIPDAVITIDNGIVFYSTNARLSIFNAFLNHYYEIYPERLFIHIDVKEELILLWFIVLLLTVHAPHIEMSDSILLPYLDPFAFPISIKLYPLEEGSLLRKKDEGPISK